MYQADGTQAVLGGTEASRGQASGKTARWYIDTTTDVNGHQARYRYWTNQGKVYWKGVDYQVEAVEAYQNHVAFTYESRLDVTKDFRYGDLEQTGYRLCRIDVSQGATLIRRYTMGYATDTLWSQLETVDMVGKNNLPMPRLKMAYLGTSPRSGRYVRMQGYESLDGLLTGRATLEDINADGLPDLVQGTASAYSYQENVDGVAFSRTPITFTASKSPDRALNGSGVLLADVDGDGYRDVWYPDGNGDFLYYSGGDITNGRFNGFRVAKLLRGHGLVSDATAAALRLMDMNGDGRTDLLQQRIGQGDVWYENSPSAGLTEHSIPSLPNAVTLSARDVELLDFNGDGYLDLVQKAFDWDQQELHIWYGTGNGRYWPEMETWLGPAAGASEVHLTDVNGDGQTDLVRVSGAWVSYYLNDGRGAYRVRHGQFKGMPEASDTKKVLLADMNGNGTSDVV